MKEEGHVRREVIFRALVIGLGIFLTTHIATQVPAFAKVYLTVGILNEPKNLNPFQETDSWTKRVTMFFYQPLYIIHPDTMNLTPWLAEDQPVYDPSKRILTFRVRQMEWDDGTPFSAFDVVFTANVFKRFQIPKYYQYWEFVEKVEALDARTVQIALKRSMAVLYTRTLTSWIVQKKKWEPVIRKAEERLKEVQQSQKANGMREDEALKAALEEALKIIQNHKVTKPTGLGPFKYEEREIGSAILLVKNERFFGLGKTIGGRKLGPYIDRVIFKIYENLGTATSALEKGDIDFLWRGISHASVEDLIRDPHTRVPMALDRGYRYLGFNLRKAPMSDPAFRQAIAYLIDKDFLVKRVLHFHGQRQDSVIPPTNAFFFNPDTTNYGKAMDRDRRIQEAYRILTSAGYRWKKPPLDSRGEIQDGEGLISPQGEPVPSITLLTPPPNYDTEMAATGRAVQGWLQDFGISISWQTMAFGGLMRKVRSERDFDLFILGWRGLSLDPDYIRRFFHSSFDRPNGWNDTGYTNADFDRLAERQLTTMDFQARRKIILDLQMKLMKDLPYIPLYVPHRLEGIRTDRFEGWVTREGGVGNHWTFCLLRPTEWWKESHPLHR